MFKSRLFEEAAVDLWQEGLISGEMHLGIGEEAIVARVVAHLCDGARVCTEETIPYSRELEDQTLPNTRRILTLRCN